MPQALSVRSPDSWSSSARRSSRWRSASLAARICMALALFWCWLRSFWHGDHDAGGQVGEAHRRVGLVDVLAAGARGAVGVDAQVLLVDVDLAGQRPRGTGTTSSEAKLVWRRCWESNGRDPHQAVHAPLGGQQPVGVAAPDDEGGRQHPGLLALGDLVDLDVEAPPLGPALVHAQHHLGPVLGVGAAGPGVDLGTRRRARRTRRRTASAARAAPSRRVEVGQRLLELGRERLVALLLGTSS